MSLEEAAVQAHAKPRRELWDRSLRARRPAINDDGFDMPGFVGHYYMWPEEYTLLAKYVALTRGDYLEIGSMCGIIGISLARSHPKRNFVCVDNFSAGHATIGGNRDAFLENLSKHELRNVSLVEGDSLKVVPNLNQNFDVVFIDANHAYEHVLGDALNSWPLLAPGGFMAFHDYGCVEQTTQAVQDFLLQTGARLVEVVTCLAIACKPTQENSDRLSESQTEVEESQELRSQILAMRTTIEAQQQQIVTLEQENHSLDILRQAVENSAGWRLLNSWRYVRGRLAPPESLRRKLYDWAISPLRNHRR